MEGHVACTMVKLMQQDTTTQYLLLYQPTWHSASCIANESDGLLIKVWPCMPPQS
jgi:hypothetical protein